MPKHNNKLPDRWESYSNIGKVIAGTQIITFKVPLKEAFCARYPKELWFTPAILLETLEREGNQLGLIIDLTFTSRYYDFQVFTERGILYEKIFVPGKEVPNQEIVERFANSIESFVSDPNNKGKLVGVHCTHGVNRTGHLVCRYMIDRLNIEPNAAIEAYGEARGYPIERENYLDDLLCQQEDHKTTERGGSPKSPAKIDAQPSPSRQRQYSGSQPSHHTQQHGPGNRKRQVISPHSASHDRHSKERFGHNKEQGRFDYRETNRDNSHRAQNRNRQPHPVPHHHHHHHRHHHDEAIHHHYYDDSHHGYVNYDERNSGNYHGGHTDRGLNHGYYDRGYGHSYYTNGQNWSGYADDTSGYGRNSYNPRNSFEGNNRGQRRGRGSSGSYGRDSRDGGNWSLKTDSDYGRFGYNNHGRSSFKH